MLSFATNQILPSLLPVYWKKNLVAMGNTEAMSQFFPGKALINDAQWVHEIHILESWTVSISLFL